MQNENKSSSREKLEAFDPRVVKSNGLNILELLKKSCVREGGTYWIFKDNETNQV